MFIQWLNFVAMLLITGILLRYVTSMFPNTAVARAIGFAY